MNIRLRLPNRRASTTFDVEAGGLRYTATVSRFPDGRIGELFLTNRALGPLGAALDIILAGERGER